MSDSVTKIIPYEPFEVDLIEAWLDELATKGLILQDINFIFANFIKTTPFSTHFRVDYRPGINLEKESARRVLVKENGWQYVTTFSGRYPIYMTGDPSLTELPSDDATPKSSISWKDLTFPVTSLLITLMLAFLFYEQHLNGQASVFSAMVHGGFQLLILDSALIIAFFMLASIQVIAFRKLKRREKNGALRSRQKQTLCRERVQVVLKIIPVVAILCVLASFLFELRDVKQIPVQECSDTIPFPLLEEINSAEGRAFSEELKLDAPKALRALENYITKEHQVLAPEIITIRQIGPSTKINMTTDWALYAYTVEYYQMLNTPLAEQLTKELSQMSAVHETIPASQGVHALYSDTVYGQSLIIQYQNYVIEVWYRGATDLRDCIPLYEAHLGIKQET